MYIYPIKLSKEISPLVQRILKSGENGVLVHNPRNNNTGYTEIAKILLDSEKNAGRNDFTYFKLLSAKIKNGATNVTQVFKDFGNGCVNCFTMNANGFKSYVDKSKNDAGTVVINRVVKHINGEYSAEVIHPGIGVKYYSTKPNSSDVIEKPKAFFKIMLKDKNFAFACNTLNN